MPKSFAKVYKNVSKKKGARPTALHENSRDSRSLLRAGLRDQKVSKTESMRAKLNQPYLLRVQYIWDAIFGSDDEAEDGDQQDKKETEDPIRTHTTLETQSLVESFLARHSEELEQVHAARRPGRPMAGREELLVRLQKQERMEYDAGFWVPDLSDTENLKTFREWKGEWIGLNVVRFVRVDSAGVIKGSAWPPKGNS